MKVLIIGNGAREHALALSMILSKHVNKVFCCPGNPGVSKIAECVPLDEDDFEKIAEFAIKKEIDLIIPVSSESLEKGIVDFMENRGLNVFGPRKESARLEWSKYFAREFLLRRDIPSPKYAAFDRKEFAEAYAHSRKLPLVIKADGLCKNRGVSIVSTYDGANGAIRACLDGRFGEAGRIVIVEDYVHGVEISLCVICDGESYALLPSTKVYKRLLDGDKGPCIDGSAAISPHPYISAKLIKIIEEQIIEPSLRGMKEEGRPYKGFLSLEITVDRNGQPYLIEFNSSIGIMEAQTSLLLLECDLFEVIWQASKGKLSYFKGTLPSAEAEGNATVVSALLSSQGYPAEFATKMSVRFQVELMMSNYSQLMDKSGEINHDFSKIILFHDGTSLDKDRNLITAGGRVFGLTILSKDLPEAIHSLYRVIDKIDYSGKQYRKDIGKEFLELIN